MDRTRRNLRLMRIRPANDFRASLSSESTLLIKRMAFGELESFFAT